MKCNKNIDDFTLNDKLKCIENSIVVKNDKYIQRHLPKTMFSGLHDWKNARNKLVHDLVGLDYNNIQKTEPFTKRLCNIQYVRAGELLLNLRQILPPPILRS